MWKVLLYSAIHLQFINCRYTREMPTSVDELLQDKISVMLFLKLVR